MQNPDLEIFNKNTGLVADDMVSLSDDASNHLFLGTRPAGIIKFNSENNTTVNIPAPLVDSREVSVLYYEKLHDRIFADQVLHRYEKNKWHPHRKYGR